MKKQKITSQDEAYLFGVEHIAGYELRAWTCFTRLGLIELDLPEATSDQDQQRHLMALAWMQSQPPREMIRKIREKKAEKEIDEFEETFPLAAFGQLADWAARHGKAIQESMVTVLPQPKTGKDNSPPN
jgi:hypothetical protein